MTLVKIMDTYINPDQVKRVFIKGDAVYVDYGSGNNTKFRSSTRTLNALLEDVVDTLTGRPAVVVGMAGEKGDLEKANAALLAVIEFAADPHTVDGMLFLRTWQLGEWSVIAREWPEFEGADP